MKLILINLLIMLILYLAYINFNVIEGKRGKRGKKNKCSVKSIRKKCKNKKNKKKCISKQKRKCNTNTNTNPLVTPPLVTPPPPVNNMYWFQKRKFIFGNESGTHIITVTNKSTDYNPGEHSFKLRYRDKTAGLYSYQLLVFYPIQNVLPQESNLVGFEGPTGHQYIISSCGENGNMVKDVETNETNCMKIFERIRPGGRIGLRPYHDLIFNIVERKNYSQTNQWNFNAVDGLPARWRELHENPTEEEDEKLTFKLSKIDDTTTEEGEKKIISYNFEIINI